MINEKIENNQQWIVTYVLSSDCDLLIIVRLKAMTEFGEKGWAWCSICRDKEGDLLIADDHTYDIHDVELIKEFTIPGTSTTLNKGFVTTKAYPAV